MIRDITLGQYYSADSVIHKLDPRVKLVFTILYIVSLYVGSGVWCYVYAAAFLGLVIILSKVPVKFMVKGLRSILFLLVLSACFNLFLVDGNVLVKFWIIRITDNGLRTASKMVIRMVFLIMGSSLMTLTTTPNDLTDGLEKGLGFLKVIRVPVHEILSLIHI